MDAFIYTIGPKQDDPHVPPPPPPEHNPRLPIEKDDIGPKQDDPHVPPHIQPGLHINIKTPLPKTH